MQRSNNHQSITAPFKRPTTAKYSNKKVSCWSIAQTYRAIKRLVLATSYSPLSSTIASAGLNF